MLSLFVCILFLHVIVCVKISYFYVFIYSISIYVCVDIGVFPRCPPCKSKPEDHL